ncbi:MAG: SDR family oxidoreductase [Acidimicrobiia bacterium]|nr:SDR family oxidoreductase [Acidimicrobiia bacterium]
MKVLVIGASGYIGGRLVPALLRAGHEVRCMARRPENLDALPWRHQVEVAAGDVLDGDSLAEAFAGQEAVVHLVHAMGDTDDFADADRRGAVNVREAAAAGGARQIVYLGGLGPEDDDEPGASAGGGALRRPGKLSRHLASRHEVGEVLADGPVPVTELRAAVVIGSGSASFEMLRSLVEVLPVMVVPRWVSHTRCQPIAIRDVLHYLVAVLDRPEAMGKVLDIGGPSVVTYQEMMQVYARVADLPRRVIIGVPVLSPGLSSHWINLVTPLPIGLARPLVDSLTTDVVVRPDHDIRDVIPHEPVDLAGAIELALVRVRELDVLTSWSGAARPTQPAEPFPSDPGWSGGTLLSDTQTAETDASPEAVFSVVEGIGGDRGWYVADVLWRLRGVADKLAGGVGMRRGRRHPDQLRPGDALDFWRVEVVDPPHEIRLHAEMRLPGSAWLDWQIEPRPGGGATLRQRALFAPKGLFGRAYWWAMLPFHAMIFGRLCTRLAAEAHRRPAADRSVTGASHGTDPLVRSPDR